MGLRFTLPALMLFCAVSLQAQTSDEKTLDRIFDETMNNGEAYDNLHVLCKQIGHRLAGSPQADMAVRWSFDLL